MSPEIGKFLKIRNEINWRLFQLIDENRIEENELSAFCQQLTDYLLAGVCTLGLGSNAFSEEFCKRYSKGIVNSDAFVQDLSKLTIVLSERWNQEDQCIKKELCIPQ